jgi:hypothetical protein
MLYTTLLMFLSCTKDKATDSATSIDEPSETETGENDSTDSPVVFAASDVDQSSIDRTIEWFGVANNAWYTEDSFGWGQYDPVYLVLVGEDMQATIDLEQRYCDYLNEHHPDSAEYSSCNPNYTDPSCQYGICMFTEYVTNGGAAIASSRQNDGYHLMITAAKNPSPQEDDYKRVVLHESFHIYQLSQHTETDYDTVNEIQGRRSGDHNEDVPWWMEGVAEYMAIMLYAKQDGVRADYAQQEFRYKIGYYDENSGTPVIDEYFALETKLYNITYGEDAWLAYSLGAWFVAYLINEHGEQALFDFYQELNARTFDDNFSTQFGKDHRQIVTDFETFLQQDPSQLISIIP